jgi:hypothetical protein
MYVNFVYIKNTIMDMVISADIIEHLCDQFEGEEE